MDEILQISPTNICVNVRCKGDGKWVHVVMMFEPVSNGGTVLPTTGGNDNVVAAIPASIAAEQVSELPLTFCIINYICFLVGIVAGVTYSVFIEFDPWALVGNDTPLTVTNIDRETVHSSYIPVIKHLASPPIRNASWLDVDVKGSRVE